MKPTQLEADDGSRSTAATDDDFLACTFNKFADEDGMFDKNAAMGAVVEIMKEWKYHSNPRIS